MPPSDEPRTSRPRPLWDAWMVLLALLSIGMIFWHAGADARTQARLVIADLVIVAFFLGEWVVRLVGSPNKARYIRRSWYELLGMAPLHFSQVGFLRFLRLIRILRVIRVLPALRTSLRSIERIATGSHLTHIAVAGGSVTVIGSVLVWLAERAHNPALADYGESLWWAVVTVTTVGYGDITPITPLGRALAVVLMVVGIGIIGLLASQVSVAVLRTSRIRDGVRVSDAGGATSVEGRLERLAALHAGGSLTDDEFAVAKARVLR